MRAELSEICSGREKIAVISKVVEKGGTLELQKYINIFCMLKTSRTMLKSFK